MGTNHPVIWLQPWCEGCERHSAYNEGRLWCQDDVWGKCDECDEKSVKYVLALDQPLKPDVGTNDDK